MNKRANGNIVWKCLCDCGRTCEVSSNHLQTNNTKSCGCLLSDTKKGDKNPNWNPNLTDEYRANYKKYTRSASVRKKVFERDNYTCQCCTKRGTYLNAHHLDSYYGFPDKREDVNNLVTLCVKCHKGFHKKYGRGINTKDEFVEYQRSF